MDMMSEAINLLGKYIKLEDLDGVLIGELTDKFLQYLQHGRTLETVEIYLQKFCKFFRTLGYLDKELANVIIKCPNILNCSNNLYEKYIFLNQVFNGTGVKEYVLRHPIDFGICSFDTIYARWGLCLSTGYYDFKLSTLIKSTSSEFEKIFVKGRYKKPYKIYDSVHEVTAALASYDSSQYDLSVGESLPCNLEFLGDYNIDSTFGNPGHC